MPKLSVTSSRLSSSRQSVTFLNRNLLLQRLTKRELEVLGLVFTGYSSKRIAQKLDLSPRTVEVHRANLMNKLGVSSLPQLVEIVLKSQQELEATLIKKEEHLNEAQRIAHLGSWAWEIASSILTPLN